MKDVDSKRIFRHVIVMLGLLMLGACDGGETTTTNNAGGSGDTTAPAISNIMVSNITETSALVSWTTDEASTSQIQYGITDSYGSSAGDSGYVTSHGITVTDLTADTVYHYHVVSADGTQNSTSSTDATFTTLAMVDPPVLQYSISLNISGMGTVTSVPAGIDCTSDCSANFDNGTSVTLTANPGANYQFSVWSGACVGSGNCVVTLDTDQIVTATFTQNAVTDLNCSGTWLGSEETTNITAWPYRDCFRTDPVAGGRTRLSLGTGGAVDWEQGAGWNGQNALRVRPPDGSLGDFQGYAGLGEHSFHAVRTKQLNIRYLIRYNANWAQYAQRNKWEVAIKYDYSNPAEPVRLQGCERGIAEGRSDPLNGARENFTMQQGVCTQAWNVPNLNGWNFGSGVRENEWISVENEFDLTTGWYRTYITTQDGVFNQSLHSEINIGMGVYGAPAETVPNPNWWGSIDCSAGCFLDYPNDLGTVPRPVDTYIWYSHFVMSNTRIGPPAGFVQ